MWFLLFLSVIIDIRFSFKRHAVCLGLQLFVHGFERWSLRTKIYTSVIIFILFAETLCRTWLVWHDHHSGCIQVLGRFMLLRALIMMIVYLLLDYVMDISLLRLLLRALGIILCIVLLLIHILLLLASTYLLITHSCCRHAFTFLPSI